MKGSLSDIQNKQTLGTNKHILVVWITDIKSVDNQKSEKPRPNFQFAFGDFLITVQITAISFKSFFNKVSKQLTDISWHVFRWKLEKGNGSLDLHCPALDSVTTGGLVCWHTV